MGDTWWIHCGCIRQRLSWVQRYRNSHFIVLPRVYSLLWDTSLRIFREKFSLIVSVTHTLTHALILIWSGFYYCSSLNEPPGFSIARLTYGYVSLSGWMILQGCNFGFSIVLRVSQRGRARAPLSRFLTDWTEGVGGDFLITSHDMIKFCLHQSHQWH